MSSSFRENVQHILGEYFRIPFYIFQAVDLWITSILTIAGLIPLWTSAPRGFPTSGNGLWFKSPANVWSSEWLPVGNGYLAAMVHGGTSYEMTQLNIESLWSGGPFSNPRYNGGNRRTDQQVVIARDMQAIRRRIFQSPTGRIHSISELTTHPGSYGSYAGAGFLISNINTTGPVSNYARWLDLDQGVAHTTWTQSRTTYLRSTFCSNPTQACTEHITMTTLFSSGLPSLSFAFSSELESGLPTPNVTCLGSDTLLIRGLIEPARGMLYEVLARVHTTPVRNVATTKCIPFKGSHRSPPNATIQVIGGTSREAWISWVGGTEYSLDAGNMANNYSFRGADPHVALFNLISTPTAVGAPFSDILTRHVADYKAVLTDKFSLSLGQRPRLDLPTDQIKAAYQVDVGDQYLEWLLFNYGRYLLASSSRGILPANLQGKWANKYGNAWSADYHSNINIQMNYWAAEMTNLDVIGPLFDYMERTWAPRGAYTAQVLYNISRGWVTHNEMNIFGHTGMKGPGNTAQWANYPEANAWMMMHVWDHFDYTHDVAWWKAQGWPLLKGVASFHLEKLIPDLHFNDSSLVTNPCNSPEQKPITFGCAHAQQLIWQLLNAIEKGFDASGDTDIAFLDEVKAKRARMDKGLHVGSWGQLREWKVDQDSPTDTHRHLSHLIGIYPGYAISGYDHTIQGNYTKQQIIDAATISLIHRGSGTGPDADSGWEKVWRASMWAQLGNATEFYHELSYTIQRNFGSNLFSLYNPSRADTLFQIDANLGYPAAVLNALIQAPDVASLSTPLTITLLPALPRQWPSGYIKGARIRGGLTLDLEWSNGRPRNVLLRVDANIIARPVQIMYGGRVLASFTTSAGLSRALNKL